MSQQTSGLRALADAAYGALSADDLEAFEALVDDDVEFTSLIAEAEGTTFHGRAGVRSWWETVRGTFQELRVELLDFREAGDQAVGHVRMVGTVGGIRVEQTMWNAARVRDGKLSWWAFFRGERDALEAVGLSE
jgi:ketosteroid isomerase-like protein